MKSASLFVAVVLATIELAMGVRAGEPPPRSLGVAEARQAALADAVIAGPPINLELPLHRGSTFQILDRVLRASGVPYGLESAVPIAGPPIDLGAEPEKTVALTGRRLRDALDVIVGADPRYYWTEADGRVIVRGVIPAGGVPDLFVSSVRMQNASPREALVELLRVLDPNRPVGTGVLATGLQVQLSPGMVAAQKPAPIARPISVSMDGRVLDVLNAIANAHGSLSWSVRYEGPSTVQEALISLMAPGTSVAAIPGRAMAARGTRGAAPRRLTIPVMSEIEGMLSIYGRQAKVLLGAELIQKPGSRPPPSGVPGLDLTDRSPAAAVAEIVSYDSRYVWSNAGGIFNVTPKPDLPERSSLLDRTVDGFALNADSLDAAADRVSALFGAPPSNRSFSLAGIPSARAQMEVRGRARTVTMSVPQGATIRDVLNAICVADGTISWTFAVQRHADGSEFVRMQWTGLDGWSLNRNFTVK